MGRRERKTPGKCIFCGCGGVTKEHIWSDWLGELIPRQKTHVQGVAAFDFDRTTEQFRVLHPASYEQKQGCLTQRKVRKVCDSCNSGWMSRAVQTAKPVAEKLAQGFACKCDTADLAKLVPWIGIAAIMQEFVAAPSAIFIPAEDRNTLMETKLPPNDWTIWIGYYGGAKWNPMGHCHYTALLHNESSIEAGIAPKFPSQRIQIATYSIRNLFVHVFTASALGLVNEYRQFVRDQNWNLFQLWPAGPDPMLWPRFPIMDGELRAIVTKFGTDRLGHRDMGFDFRS